MDTDSTEPEQKSTLNAVVQVRELIPPGSNQVTLILNGQPYTLRITQSNKLILTK